MRQVPLPMTRERLRPVYNYHRQDRTDKYPDNVCTTTVDPRRLRGRQVPRRDPEHLRNVYDYETCTTTSTTIARMTTSPMKREQLLPLQTVSAPNTRFEGITPRRRPRTNACVL